MGGLFIGSNYLDQQSKIDIIQSFLQFIFSGFFGPASEAILPQIVPPFVLVKANVVTSLVNINYSLLLTKLLDMVFDVNSWGRSGWIDIVYIR